jgi:hypothetical protein
MPDSQAAVAAYIAAWSENDPARRSALLDGCWHPDATIEIGERRFRGRAEVEREIARFRAQCPEDRGELTSDVDTVGNWLRFTVRVVRPDGSHYSEVLDIGELDDRGRFRRILTFRQP